MAEGLQARPDAPRIPARGTLVELTGLRPPGRSINFLRASPMVQAVSQKHSLHGFDLGRLSLGNKLPSSSEQLLAPLGHTVSPSTAFLWPMGRAPPRPRVGRSLGQRTVHSRAPRNAISSGRLTRCCPGFSLPPTAPAAAKPKGGACGLDSDRAAPRAREER